MNNEKDQSVRREVVGWTGQLNKTRDIVLLTLMPGQEIAMHQHDGFDEETKVVSGVGLFSFDLEGSGNKINLRATEGDESTLAEGEHHAILNIGKENLILQVTEIPWE